MFRRRRRLVSNSGACIRGLGQASHSPRYFEEAALSTSRKLKIHETGTMHQSVQIFSRRYTFTMTLSFASAPTGSN